MKLIDNNEFIKSIYNNLERMPPEAKRDFTSINKIFLESDINIMGGFVRDSILEVLYGYNFPINDLDILITDKNFVEKTNYFEKKHFSKLGGLKFKYNNFSIDLFGINQIYFLNENPFLAKNLENVLKGVDISTSAIAYNIGKGEIYDESAMEGIYKKEVNILNPEVVDSGTTITRLIIHADKMNFKIGEIGIKYIKENYSSKAEKEIKDYLKYKEITHLFPLVKKTLGFILK